MVTGAADRVSRYRWTGALSAAVAACLAGCSSSTDSSIADAEAAIAEFNREYLAAINEGDIAARHVQ
jgi:hypothetical protein